MINSPRRYNNSRCVHSLQEKKTTWKKHRRQIPIKLQGEIDESDFFRLKMIAFLGNRYIKTAGRKLAKV